MAGGYVKLWRSTLDSQIMTDDWMCRLFVWCILRANYTSGNFRGTPLAPGQFVTGRISGAAELNVSPSKWLRGIQKLVDIGFLKYEANSSWTTLTVCNWDTYQNDADSNEQQADSKRTAGDTTNGQPADTIEEGKKERRKEGKKQIPPKSPTGGHRRKTVEPISVAIPDSLNNPEFLSAWSRWQTHRIEIKKALTQTQAETQITEFESWGTERAIAAINFTVMKGWQGLVEPDERSQSPKPKKEQPIYPTPWQLENWSPTEGCPPAENEPPGWKPKQRQMFGSES